MTEAVRAGFIGTGFMATVHTRAARAARAELRAIAGSSQAKAKDAAAELGVERAEADVASMATESDLDVIHVCSPNALHAEHALAALAAGTHVICEKPLATSVHDARRMVEAAAGLVTAVPFAYRYHPMVRQARALVAAGEVGRILTIDAAYLQDWLLGADETNWRADGALGGASRAFADIGSHLCDLLEFVTGARIARLTARTRTVYAERAGAEVANEDIAALLVEFDGGALGTLLISQLAPGHKNALTFEVHGTTETVRFAQESPEQLWLGRKAGSQLVMRDAETLAPDAARLSIVPSGHPMGYQDAFNALVADAYAAIAGETPDGLPTFADGLRAAQLTEAVLASAAHGGTWIETPFEEE
ncbi:MAG: Gfo/Idh/MocA family oxidoreductase [Microbacterium sp.]